MTVTIALAAPSATTTNWVFGGGYAAVSNISTTTTQQYTGAGSWHELYPSSKTDFYIDPASTFGATWKVQDIARITYHTLDNDALPTDFYLVVYTNKNTNCSDGGHSWYCHALVGEPVYSNGYVTPISGVWNTWTTNAGANQLVFYDYAHTSTYGFYGAPTWQNILAGPVTWSSYIGSGSTTPVGYTNEDILYLSFQTGSGWSSFEGWLDSIEIEMSNGDIYNIDLEDFTSPVYVDDDWTGSATGLEVAPGKFFGWNAFAKIQDAIDNVAPAGTVNVFPGLYDETASNRYLYDSSGPYQFGLFLDQTRDGLTVQGVDAAGTPITDPAHLEAGITTNATNNFGASGIFVEADGVTLRGLEFDANIPGDNKTIEVIGDDFTLMYSVTNIPPEGGSIYINDWRFDSGTSTSYVQSYHIEGNWFKDSTSVDVASGAGYSGPVSGRKILNNQWDMLGTSWNSISFNGTVPTVGWYVYPVSGATITGNTFNGAGVSYIRARGTYNEASFDWNSYWTSNTYDKAVVGGVNPPNDVQAYSYTSGIYVFDNVRRIGATVQGEVDNAPNGNILLVKAGTYEEQVVVDGKALTLKGESLGAVIKAPATVPTCFTTSSDKKPVVCAKNDSDLTLDTLTVDGAGRGNSNYQFVGVAFRNSAGTVKNSLVKDIRDTPFSGSQHGVGIYAYNDDVVSRTIHVLDNTLTGFQKNAMAINAGDTTPLVVDIQGNIVTGAGPTTVTAQNGIQVWADLGTGTVDGNTVSGIAYDNTLDTTKWVATSILNYYGDLDITNNIITGAHMGVYNIDGAGNITGNNLTIEKVGVYAYGIEATDPPEAVPSPYNEQAHQSGSQALVPGSAPESTTATLVLNVSNNTLTFSGTDNTSTFGIEADAGYGPDDLNVTANHNTVSGFEVGIEFYKCEVGCLAGDTGVFVNLVAEDNCLAGNTFGMRSNEPALTVAAANNWWGDATGPYHPSKNVGGLGSKVSDYIDFEPWIADGCRGTVTTGHWKNLRTGEFNELPGLLASSASGDTIQGVCTGSTPIPGGGTASTGGITIDLNGCTVGPGSPFLNVMAPDVTVLGPGVLDGTTAADDAIIIHGGGDNFILENVEIKNWINAVHLVADVESFKMVGNWVHNQSGVGLLTDTGVDLSGVVTVEGNLFKDNGQTGVRHQGNGTLKAIYNSWGDDAGPFGPLGDGVDGLSLTSVAYDPWTFSEIYFDLDPSTIAGETFRRVAETETFDVAIMGDAENLYGLSFVFYYDPTKLTLNSTTFTSPWTWTSGSGGTCTPLGGLPADQIGYYCSLTTGAEWDGGTIATFNFTATNSGASFFDVFVDDSLSSAAKGGIKVFVNNAGYNAPSMPERYITDPDDGRITIDDIANFTGFVDLQGRTNDSGASIKVYDAASGGTLLAQATSASSGKYTTVYEGGQWMVVSTPPGYTVSYYLFVDRALYLPSPVPYVSALLTGSPTTSLVTIVLLGGDSTDNDLIDITDASCIGSAYGSTNNNCTGGPGANSDVNGDGKVDILDLTLMGGNFTLTTSTWTP